MSRRKQARPLPSRLLDDEEEEQDGELKTGGVNNKATDQINEALLTDKEDANNNESKEKESEDEDEDDEELLKRENAKTLAIQNLLSNLQWPAVGSGFSLEALQNTKVAVAQLAANALANNNGENAQDMAVLQSTLFTLQQQQVLQLQLIQQLQQQLHVSNNNSDEEQLSSGSLTPQHPGTGRPQVKSEDEEIRKPRSFSKENNVIAEDEIIDEEEEGTKSNSGNNGLRNNNNSGSGGNNGSGGLNPAFASQFLGQFGHNQDPNRPLSPGIPLQFNNNHPTQTDVPNTLEMLQKRTQEVLDNASQGLLASSLHDDQRKKMGPYEKGREPFFKHRCRYCGKVFGSDSALQIHIRSHTGERPFKCNVCGSRFTTKGNLKVHFQRHTSKFPGIKMNPHPVPEHLDHFHPPLIQNNSSNPTTPEHSPNPQPAPSLPQQLGPPPSFLPHHAPFFSPLFRFDVKPPTLPFFNNNVVGKEHPPLSPQDLTNKPKKPVVSSRREERDEEEDIEDDRKSDRSLKGETEDEGGREDGEMQDTKDTTINEEKESIHDGENDRDNEDEEQPENLSSKSLPLMYPLPLVAGGIARPSRPSSSSASTPTPASSSRSEKSPTPIRFPPNMHQHHQQKMVFDPAKDPAIYTNLLPRPGSNDNAWESLIEVTKTSETSKLQQLVDNIEHKLTDPNECIICHRVLSCKSALQMHYRTHTGERPFKCKICGRAFTTKGNLKTHMGVHRAKPPLRVLHQCPVCHKRFTNSLVLQQHIRLHTGEPTDLSPEQIRAAEVKDGYPPFGNPLFGSFGSVSEGEEQFMNDDTTTSETNESVDSEIKSSKPTTGSSALENQVRTIISNTTTAAANLSSPKLSNHANDSSCSSNGGSPPPGPNSQASIALDLTPPRNGGPQIFNPFHHLPPPPINFPASLLTPTTTNAVAALANLTSFNPVIVPPRPAGAQARGNTTCQICLKTFACNSALEIHYRSHTKERPFKCNICDRGFSTKGNMKQHQLTHKIRQEDMTSKSNSSYDSPKQNGLGQSDDSNNKSPPESPKSQNSQQSNNQGGNGNHKRPASPVSPPQPPKKVSEGLPSSSASNNSDDKHLCKVCSKNFSSSSALNIHMRVHTGDRPFACQVCQKSFTTKGNLKVHMGTHVFSGTSRRGRRMSLDPMTVFLPHPHHPQLPHPLLGTTTIKSAADLHLPHRPGPPELYFPFSNASNAQPSIALPNGSLKVASSPSIIQQMFNTFGLLQSSPKDEDVEEDEDEEDRESRGEEEEEGEESAGSCKENGGEKEEEEEEKRLCIKEEKQEA